MITETLSFGAWSRIFKNLHHFDQKKVAERFNISRSHSVIAKRLS
ncbi:hypothetical protein [Sodalis ligni]